MSEEGHDVETEEETIEVPEMHLLFADWLRPSDLGINRETLQLRWATIVRLKDELLTDEDIQELICVALGAPLQEDGPDHWFRQALKQDDNLFPMQAGDNETEIANLAAACLATCLDDDEDPDRSRSLATMLLAASFSESREYSCGTDLIKSAKQHATNCGMESRTRSAPQLPVIHIPNRTTAKKTIDEVTNEPETIKTALNGVLSELNNQLRSANKNISQYSEAVAKQTRVRDEELEILWWVFGEKSHLLNTAIADIESAALPLVLGVEFAQRTSIDAELPSLQGLLAKAGLALEESVDFKSVIDAAKKQSIELLTEDEYCPYVTPVLHALAITKENNSWQKIWETDTGLKAKSAQSKLEWATQIYRETLFIRRWR